MRTPKRTYTGPIIEHCVEEGIVQENPNRHPYLYYRLAIDDGSGELILIVEYQDNYAVSRYNFTAGLQTHTVNRRFLVTNPCV